MAKIDSIGFAAREGRRDNVPIHEEFLRRVPNGATVLDLGCGGGDYARSMAKLGYIVYACDPGIDTKTKGLPDSGTETVIDNKNSINKITFFQARAESLHESLKKPYFSTQFDAIWMKYSLPWVDNHYETLYNVSNYLKVGGILYLEFFEPIIVNGEVVPDNVKKKFTPESLAEIIDKCELPLQMQFCELLPPSPPKKDKNGNILEVKDPIKNPATVLILQKTESFKLGMNLDENGRLKIEKTGSHGAMQENLVYKNV
jgi:SAM-dependent methyltransferase